MLAKVKMSQLKTKALKSITVSHSFCNAPVIHQEETVPLWAASPVCRKPGASLIPAFGLEPSYLQTYEGEHRCHERSLDIGVCMKACLLRQIYTTYTWPSIPRYIQTQPAPLFSSRTFSSSTTETMSIKHQVLYLGSASHCSTPSLNSVTLGITQCLSISALAYFTYNVLKIQPCCSIPPNFLPFRGWIGVHSLHLPHSTYPFVNGQSGCYYCLSIMNNVAETLSVQLSTWVPVFTSFECVTWILNSWSI